MYKKLELFLLLFLIVKIIHYSAVFSFVSLIAPISQSALWGNMLMKTISILFIPFDIIINDSLEAYHAIYLEPAKNFIFIAILLLAFLCLFFCYLKAFFFIFRIVVALRGYTIVRTGKFLDEVGFVITWFSIIAVYNQIFYALDEIVFSKSIMYDSLHSLILMLLFFTKSYGIEIKQSAKALET